MLSLTKSYSSYSTVSLHSEVPAQLLPDYLGGAQDVSLSYCVTAARRLESHFSANIKHAGSQSNKIIASW